MPDAPLPTQPTPPTNLTARQWLTVAAILGVVVGGAWWALDRLMGPRPLKDWPMTDHHGRRTQWSDFRGKWLIVYFGYTHCPEACPTGLSRMAEALRQLGTTRRPVQVVMVTVDPSRDTPKMLAGYVPYFHRDFLGITPAPSRLEDVTKPFGVRWERVKGPGGDEINHTLSFFLVDPQGRLKSSFVLPVPPDTLRRQLTP